MVKLRKVMEKEREIMAEIVSSFISNAESDLKAKILKDFVSYERLEEYLKEFKKYIVSLYYSAEELTKEGKEESRLRTNNILDGKVHLIDQIIIDFIPNKFKEKVY